MSLATDICNKDYPNCTNPCAAANKECCQCEMSNTGPTKVCSCCPQVSKWNCCFYYYSARLQPAGLCYASVTFFPLLSSSSFFTIAWSKEILETTRSTASRKATGPDDVPAELFKAGGETALDRMHRICVAIWETDEGQRNGRSPHSSHFPRKVTLSQNNCCGFPCKQDPSPHRTEKNPSEDRNRNCRRAGRIPTR